MRLSFTFSAIAEDPCPGYTARRSAGRYVFVPAALFIAAQARPSSPECWRHTMEHIAQRHGTPRQRGNDGKLLEVPLIFMGVAVRRACDFLSGSWHRKRSAELEADFLAVQTIARARFYPRALVISARVQVQPAGPFRRRTHPARRDQRLAAMLSAIEKCQPSTTPPARRLTSLPPGRIAQSYEAGTPSASSHAHAQNARIAA